MFRLRSTTSIFKLVLAISVAVLVFIIIQMSYLPGADHKQTSSEQLEERLVHLESDLSQSRRVAGELHEAVRQLITVEPPAGAPPQQVFESKKNGKETRTWEREKDFGGACAFAETPPKSTDVQMLEVYKEDPFENNNGGVWTQGWEVTYQPDQWGADNKLRVFVVPHSHNDPGWIKTFEHYYSAQTRHIFNSMLESLDKYPRMKFIWAEISYLSLWWAEASPEDRERLKKQVSRGQLELVTAGWVMPDEANSHYWSLLDQLVTGHEWLRLNLNANVSNSWSIDPFGMSPTQAYLLQRSGFDHMLIQRVHYAMKRRLASQQQLEFWWRQTWDSGDSTDMFCHLMPFFSYDIPHTCGPDPKVCCQFDFARLPGGRYTCPWRVSPRTITPKNVDKRAATLLDQYRKKSQLYQSNVLLVPLGDDFRYDSSNEWELQYTNYQALFDHMNSQADWHVEAQFGTLSDYFNALEQDARRSSPSRGLSAFPRLSGDFFTYADKNDEYWSGYFTSRPFHKSMDRVLMGQLRAAEILYSLTLSSVGSAPSAELSKHLALLMSDLVVARRALALFQHHDGITGTAKDRVVVDYATKMLNAQQRCERVIQQSAHLLLAPAAAISRPDLKQEYYLLSERRQGPQALSELRVLELTSEEPRTVVLYNSLGHRRAEVVTLHVSSARVQVRDAEGNPVASQCAPVFDGAAALVAHVHKLQFVATLLPLSLTSYTVKSSSPSEETSWSHHSLASVTLSNVPPMRQVPPAQLAPYTVQYVEPEAFTLTSPQYRVEFGSDGLMTSLGRTGDRESLSAVLEFVSYGVKQKSGDRSGAYIFMPDGPARTSPRSAWPRRLERGALLSSVTVQLPDVLHQVALVASEDADAVGHVEISNVADVSRQRNFELAMRLTTGVESGDRFVTDLNSFQTIERRTFEKLPLQANYYPVAGMMYIEDGRSRLSLTLGQPLGGASLRSGQIEVMLDRRLMQDDNRGVGQGVTDTLATLSTFRLLLEHPPAAAGGSQTPAKPLPSLAAHTTHRSQLHPAFALFETPANLIEVDEGHPRAGAVTARRSQWASLEDSGNGGYGDIGGSTGSGGLACDLELVSLRTEVASSDGGDAFTQGRTSLLTVRRLASDCRYEDKLATRGCSGALGKFKVSVLLPAAGYQPQARQVSLTGVHEGRSISVKSALALDPMEIYAFRLTRN